MDKSSSMSDCRSEHRECRSTEDVSKHCILLASTFIIVVLEATSLLAQVVFEDRSQQGAHLGSAVAAVVDRRRA